MGLQALDRGGGDFGIQQHAALGGVNADVGGDGVDLGGHGIGRHGFDAGNAEGILGRDAGDGARAVDAVHGDRPQVGLDARAAAAVGTGHGHRDGDAIEVGFGEFECWHRKTRSAMRICGAIAAFTGTMQLS